MDTLAQAIIDIYSSPGNSKLLDHAVHTIENACGGGFGAYMLIDLQSSLVTGSSHPNYPDWYVKKYELEGAEKDIRLHYADRVLPGKTYRDFEYIPDMKEYARSEWIQYQHQTLGLFHSMVSYISPHGLWTDYFTLNRTKEDGPYTDKERDRLQFLLPHLARAAEINRWADDLQRRYQAVLSVLDKLLVGLVILDTQGRVVVANNMAQSIRDDSGAFALFAHGRMKLSEENQQVRFKQLIGSTGGTASGGDDSDGGQLVLRNRSSGKEILLEIMPIRDDGFSDSDKVSGTAVFVLDPYRSQQLSADGLGKVFNLTQSENLITHSLLNGLNINEIAEDRNTSSGTVRGQVKDIYAKTGAHSQLDLLRLAVKLNPPVEK